METRGKLEIFVFVFTKPLSGKGKQVKILAQYDLTESEAKAKADEYYKANDKMAMHATWTADPVFLNP